MFAIRIENLVRIGKKADLKLSASKDWLSKGSFYLKTRIYSLTPHNSAARWKSMVVQKHRLCLIILNAVYTTPVYFFSSVGIYNWEESGKHMSR